LRVALLLLRVGVRIGVCFGIYALVGKRRLLDGILSKSL
jgi:hypothetical protein